MLGRRIEAGALLPMAGMEKKTNTAPATAINIDQLRLMCTSVGARNTDTALGVSLRCSFTLGLRRIWFLAEPSAAECRPDVVATRPNRRE